MVPLSDCPAHLQPTSHRMRTHAEAVSHEANNPQFHLRIDILQGQANQSAVSNLLRCDLKVDLFTNHQIKASRHSVCKCISHHESLAYTTLENLLTGTGSIISNSSLAKATGQFVAVNPHLSSEFEAVQRCHFELSPLLIFHLLADDGARPGHPNGQRSTLHLRHGLLLTARAHCNITTLAVSLGSNHPSKGLDEIDFAKIPSMKN